MKTSLLVLAAVVMMAAALTIKKKNTAIQQEAARIKGSYKPVAVLELFTSEGCSSCPPADRLLAELAKQDNDIIPLSFHVDYWNGLGWTDPFSNSEYSERQRIYSNQFNLESVYTPQLIINGKYEMVGSDRNKAASVIKEVLEEKALVQLGIEDVKIREMKMDFTVQQQGDLKRTDLIALLVRKNAVIKVKAGENKGAELSHTNVVRSFIKQAASGKNEIRFELPADIKNNNWEIIVFTQQKTGLKITGAVKYEPDHQ
ncbi:MAG: DUF1223 domain-containing protein [Chitinophagaceae bacterium]